MFYEKGSWINLHDLQQAPFCKLPYFSIDNARVIYTKKV